MRKQKKEVHNINSFFLILMTYSLMMLYVRTNLSTRQLYVLPRMPPMVPRNNTTTISIPLYITLAWLTSYIIKPPSPNSPHFPVAQYWIPPLKTTATTAVVKNVLQRRALRHLEYAQKINTYKFEVSKLNTIQKYISNYRGFMKEQRLCFFRFLGPLYLNLHLVKIIEQT